MTGLVAIELFVSGFRFFQESRLSPFAAEFFSKGTDDALNLLQVFCEKSFL